jgi:hypothetical protein
MWLVGCVLIFKEIIIYLYFIGTWVAESKPDTDGAIYILKKNIWSHNVISAAGDPDHVDLPRGQVCGPAQPQRRAQLSTPTLRTSTQALSSTWSTIIHTFSQN